LSSVPIEVLTFRGHRNVLGTHPNTIELTREEEISTRADCIIGVSCDKACAQLNPLMKRHIQGCGGLRFELRVGQTSFDFQGSGTKGLTLDDPLEFVVRKSYFESPRTAAIRCNAAAIDIPRHLIQMMRDPTQEGTLTMIPVQPESHESETTPLWEILS